MENPAQEIDETHATRAEKPDWLQALESQSWQAELIVSGLAILGSLQLPGLIHRLVDLALFRAPDSALDLLGVAFIYPYFAASTMIISFLLHLVLRTLWIGLVGLASVYPEGINRDYEEFGPDYLQKLIAEFPDITDLNARLDKLCSTIFAVASAFIIIMVQVGLCVVLVGVLSSIVHRVWPQLELKPILIVCLSFIVLIGFVSALLGTKSFREREWVKRIRYPLNRFFNKMMYNIAYEPVMYIMQTLLTHLKIKRFYSLYFLLMVLLSLSSILFVSKSNIFLAEHDRYFASGNRTHSVLATHYETLHQEGELIYSPILSSDRVSGSTIRLFLPWPQREQDFADALCGTFKSDNDADRITNRNARAEFRAECWSRYFQVELNGEPLDGLKFYRHTHPNRDEKGVLTYLPTTNCRPFENELRIVSHYTNEDGDQRVVRIPFIFDPSS